MGLLAPTHRTAPLLRFSLCFGVVRAKNDTTASLAGSFEDVVVFGGFFLARRQSVLPCFLFGVLVCGWVRGWDVM